MANQEKINYLSQAWQESDVYEQRRQVIRNEVNSYPFIINYNCFKKTLEERDRLLQDKQDFKDRQRRLKIA